MELWAVAEVEFIDGGEKAEQWFLIHWIKIEDEWLIERAKVVQL